MTPSPRPVSLRILAVLNLLALAVLLFALVWRKLIDFDLWWHLAAGRWILDHRAVPRVDMFSFTRAGHEWIDLHWLFQVLIYLAFRRFQALGIIALKLIWIGAAWLLMLRLAGAARTSILTLFLFALGIVAGNSVYTERPASLSLLLLALTLTILWRWQETSSRWLYALPFIQWIWTNCHSLFVLGLFVIGCFFITEGLAFSRKRRTDPQAWPRFKQISLVLLLSVGAGLLTPYGLRGLVFPYQLFLEITGRLGNFNLYTSEFRPPLSGYVATVDIRAWRWLLALSAGSWILNARRLRLSLLLVWIGFAYLSWTAVRNLALFSLVAAPAAALNFAQWRAANGAWRGRFPWPRLIRVGAITLGLALFLMQAALADSVFTNRFSPSWTFGAGVEWTQFPRGAAEFLAEQKIPGPGYNTFEDGGYLIWRLYPTYQVFIDGRNEVSGPKFFNRYVQLLRNPGRFSEWTERDALRFALFRHPQSNNLPAMTWFRNNPGFALVYLDSLSALFVLRSAVAPGWLAAHEIHLEDLPPVSLPPVPAELSGWRRRWLTRYHDPGEALNLAQADKWLQLPNRAMREYIRAQAQSPECADAWIGMGGLLLEEGQSSEALRYLNFGLRLNPNSLNGHSLLAKALEASDPEAAFRHLQALVRLRPEDSRIRNNLAVYYLKHGQPAAALKEIEAGRRDPSAADNPILDLNQALALIDLKQFPAAKPLLKRYLERVPDDAGAHFLLGNLLLQMGDKAEAQSHLDFARARHYQSPGRPADPDLSP